MDSGRWWWWWCVWDGGWRGEGGFGKALHQLQSSQLCQDQHWRMFAEAKCRSVQIHSCLRLTRNTLTPKCVYVSTLSLFFTYTHRHLHLHIKQIPTDTTSMHTVCGIQSADPEPYIPSQHSKSSLHSHLMYTKASFPQWLSCAWGLTHSGRKITISSVKMADI